MIEVLFDIKVKGPALRQIILDELLGTFDANGELECRAVTAVYQVICTSAPAATACAISHTLTLEYTSYDPFWKTTDGDAGRKPRRGTEASSASRIRGTRTRHFWNLHWKIRLHIPLIRSLLLSTVCVHLASLGLPRAKR